MGIGGIKFSPIKKISYPIAQTKKPGQFAGFFDLDFPEMEEIDALDLAEIQKEVVSHVDNGNEDIRVDLGVVLSLLGLEDQAIRELEIASNNKDRDALYILGRILLDRKTAPQEVQEQDARMMVQQEEPQVLGPSWTEVVNHLREAIKHDPRNIPAQYFLGQAIQGLIKEESTKNVMDAFSVYLEAGAPIGNEESVKTFIASQNPETQREAAFEAGGTAFKKGDYKASREAFEEAIRLGHEDAWYFLGRVFEEEKDFYRAADAFDKCMEMDIEAEDSRKRRASAIDRLFRDVSLMHMGRTEYSSTEEGSPNIYLTQLLEQLEPHKNEIVNVRYSPDGKYILSGSFFGVVKLWNVSTGVSELTFKTDMKFPLSAFAPNGQQFVIVEAEGEAALYDLESKKNLHKLSYPVVDGDWEEIRVIEYFDDNQRILTITWTGTCSIWDANRGEVINEFELPMKYFDFLQEDIGVHCKCLPNGQFLLAVDQTVEVWDSDEGKVVYKEELSLGDITALDVRSLDNEILIACAARREVVLIKWRESAKFKELFFGELDGAPPFAVHITPDLNHLIVGSTVQQLEVFEIPKGKLVHSITVGEGNILSITSSPDGKEVVVGSQMSNIPKVFDLQKGELLYTLPFYQPTGKTLTKSNLGMTGGVTPPPRSTHR